jgi:hypothetical protein
VKFREHPLMSYRGLCSWPPAWVVPRTSPIKVLKGEIGILTDVKMHDLSSGRLFLTIEHDSKECIGCLFLDNPAFCMAIYTTLKSFIGRTIREVGDQDLTHTL